MKNLENKIFHAKNSLSSKAGILYCDVKIKGNTKLDWLDLFQQLLIIITKFISFQINYE